MILRCEQQLNLSLGEYMKNIAKLSLLGTGAAVALALALTVAPLSLDGLKVAKAQKAGTTGTTGTLGGVYYPPQLPPVQTHPPRSPITGR